jgi:hypothetical protein
MKIRKSMVAAAAAVALGGAGAVVIPTVASAQSASHTLTFVSVTKKSIMFTKTSGGAQDTDVNAKGKTVGFDMLYFTATSSTTGSGDATVDTTGGFLYATFTVNLKTGAVSNGKVTGGTGAFTGATGTLMAKAISKTKTAVTITYTT